MRTNCICDIIHTYDLIVRYIFFSFFILQNKKKRKKPTERIVHKRRTKKRKKSETGLWTSFVLLPITQLLNSIHSHRVKKLNRLFEKCLCHSSTDTQKKWILIVISDKFIIFLFRCFFLCGMFKYRRDLRG